VTGFERRSLELKTPRYLSREEKEGLVRRLEAGERIAALAAETGHYALRITALQHYSITALQHYSITALQHYSITALRGRHINCTIAQSTACARLPQPEPPLPPHAAPSASWKHDLPRV
jgi:predicted transcriptional regulator of viral defense system